MVSQWTNRNGVMTAFSSFEEFKKAFSEVLGLLYNRDPLSPGFDFLSNRSSSFDFDNLDDPTSPQNQQNVGELTNILNIAIRMPQDGTDDSKLSEMFKSFLKDNLSKLKEKQLRRVTFIIWRPKEFPKYFTFRGLTDFKEDIIYRNVEPALSFQLELNRMKNYDLERMAVTNHKMHVYLGRAKVAKGRESTDYRLFTRSVIRHSDLVTSDASVEYLKNEGEKLVLEILGELEVAHSHPMAKKTDGNHIFVNVLPTIEMNPASIADELNQRLRARYGNRLMKLKIKYGEIRMTVKTPDQPKGFVLRLFINNESSCMFNMHLYRESTDAQTGVVKFQGRYSVLSRDFMALTR